MKIRHEILIRALGEVRPHVKFHNNSKSKALERFIGIFQANGKKNTKVG